MQKSSSIILALSLGCAAIGSGCASDVGSSGPSASNSDSSNGQALLTPHFYHALQVLRQSRDQNLLSEAEYTTLRGQEVDHFYNAIVDIHKTQPTFDAAPWLHDELRLLTQMKSEKVITEPEFNEAKLRLLSVYRAW